MNIQALRQSLKSKWLNYYKQNRPWIVKMRVWASYNGLRRPSSGYILATLSVLEPEFEQLLDFITQLNNNPDEIIAALGLNFNPDAELGLIQSSSDSHKPQTQTHTTLANGFVFQDGEKISPTQPVLSLVSQESSAIDYAPPEAIASSNLQPQPVSWSTSDRHSSTTTSDLSTKPLPAIKLALTSEATTNGKKLRVLEITTKVPTQAKTLPSLKLATEYVTKKANHVPSTNASTLAAWVDEFCQGTGINQEVNSIFR